MILEAEHSSEPENHRDCEELEQISTCDCAQAMVFPGHGLDHESLGCCDGSRPWLWSERLIGLVLQDKPVVARSSHRFAMTLEPPGRRQV